MVELQLGASGTIGVGSDFCCGADGGVGLCAAAGHGIGQKSRRGCLYSSTEGHARVCPIPPDGGGAASVAGTLCIGAV